MAYKTKEDRQAYDRLWYQKNKTTRKQLNRNYKQKLRDEVNALKGTTPCTDCGIVYPPYVMQFDHLRDKKNDVSRIVRNAGGKQLREEILKCELVCANCHAIRTHTRRISIASDAPVL